MTTAPLAARHLASFGAGVIKIEPPGGESARAWAPMRDGISHFLVARNGEKRSMTLDLRDPADAARLRALLANADVLVENMRLGALARLGFDAKRPLALNARLVYCRIAGFGARSAYPGRAAVDTVIQAMSGMMDATRGDGMALKAGISAAGIGGGATGLLAIVAALARRAQTGRSCVFDPSMQDVGTWMCQTLFNVAPRSPVEPPEEVLTVAQACTHPQTIARGLIERRADDAGRMWEVFTSPMRLSPTPASIDSLIGPPSLRDLAWKDGGAGSAGPVRASND